MLAEHERVRHSNEIENRETEGDISMRDGDSSEESKAGIGAGLGMLQREIGEGGLNDREEGDKLSQAVDDRIKDDGTKSNKMIFIHKPISTTSPEAQHAAQQVTPEKLSQLLLERGPLAIRFITKALSQEIPKFADLSASKQRRLIMSALEAGDEVNCVVFAKIGWGQWSAVRVQEASQFAKQRELTNIANSKIKDQVSSERRRSSGGTVSSGIMSTGKLSSESSEVPMMRMQPAKKSTYIDENVLVSDDEDEYERYYEDEDEDDINNFRIHKDSFRRRQSSVVAASDNSPPNELEHVVRSRLKSGSRSSQRRRQSSSKIRSTSVTKPYRSALLSLSHANSSEAHLTDPTPRRMSTHSDQRSNSMINLGTVDSDKDILPVIGSNRRESRLSFSKESSIRSTLISHVQKSTLTQQQDSAHSDTDEEDWQAIGAATLRQTMGVNSPKHSNSTDQDAAMALMSLKS